MAGFIMYPIQFDQLTSIILSEEASRHADNPTLEAYSVQIDGQSERAEVLYFGDRDLAGIAWGADPNWLEHVTSAENACKIEFGEME